MEAPTTEDGHNVSKPSWMFWTRQRYLVTFLAFLGYLEVFILKVSVSVAVVAMTSPYDVSLDNGTLVEMKDFDWSSKMQGVFLSSFFYGQVSSQVLGGWLAAQVGGARMLGWGMTITSLLTVITPPIAYTNFYLLLLARAVTGFFEGMAYPCLQEIWARWAPPQERTTMVSIGISGVPVGTVLGFQAAGVLAEFFGWASIYYVTGVVGLVWCTVWLLVVKDYPEDDPHISPEELKYIKTSIGDKVSETKKVRYPWKKICTSSPVWAIAVGIICQNWGHATFLTQLPTYMKDVFNFRLAEAGFILSVPYIVMGVNLQFAGGLADWLQNKKILTTTQVRKIFCSGALFCQAIVLFLATNLQSISGVILCLIVNIGVEAFVLATLPTNGLDLAPLHASVLFGICCMIGSVPGIISPVITGYIVTDQAEEQWHIVFYIVCALYLFGAVFYGLFASGEKQPWADEETSSYVKKRKNKNYI